MPKILTTRDVTPNFTVIGLMIPEGKHEGYTKATRKQNECLMTTRLYNLCHPVYIVCKNRDSVTPILMGEEQGYHLPPRVSPPSPILSLPLPALQLRRSYFSLFFYSLPYLPHAKLIQLFADG